MNSLHDRSDQLDPQANDQHPAALPWFFQRLWAGGLLALLTATVPLWTTGLTTEDEFPRVSLLGDLLSDRQAGGVAAAAMVVLVASLVAVLVGVGGRCSWRERRCWWCVVIAIAVLALLDQQRFQPWAYQSWLYGLVFAALPGTEKRFWITAIMVGIYGYSAAGKLDFQFLHTVGADFAATITWPLGVAIDRTWATRLAFAFPITELAVAILLVFRRTRRWGGGLALGMHVALIGLLGPWAMDHSHGVLLWNGLLAVQSLVLFIRSPAALRSDSTTLSTSLPARWPVRLILVACLVAPLSERWGYWDHWLSWALYSPHNSRAEIEIHASARDRLPRSMQAFLKPGDASDRWSMLDLEKWALEERWAPVYPQAWYQVAAAQRIAVRYQLGPAIRVVEKSVSDRWTGTRDRRYFIGQDELQSR